MLKLEGNGPVERAGYCIGKTGIRVGVLMVFDLLKKLLDTRFNIDDKFHKMSQ